MSSKDLDTIMKGLISAGLIGLFVWCFNIHAQVQVHAEQIRANSEMKVAVKELTNAINEFRVAFARYGFEDKGK